MDDRLAFEIEARVQHRRYACFCREVLNEIVISFVLIARHRLDTSATIHMHRGSNSCLLLRFDLEGERHKRCRVIVLKQRGARFLKNRGREWAPVLAEFDCTVHSVWIAGIARVSKDRTVAKRSGPKLLPTLVPANQFSLG